MTQFEAKRHIGLDAAYLTAFVLSELLSIAQIPIDSVVGIKQLTEGRFVSKKGHTCKLMLVFGCGYVLAHRHIDARLDTALEYWKHDTSMIIILAGGDRLHEGYAETVYMKTYLMLRGVPECNIVCDGTAWDTYLALAHIQTAIDDEPLLLISSSYHIKRCVVLARLLGLDAYGVSDDEPCTLKNSGNFLRDQISLYYNYVRVMLLNKRRTGKR